MRKLAWGLLILTVFGWAQWGSAAEGDVSGSLVDAKINFNDLIRAFDAKLSPASGISGSLLLGVDTGVTQLGFFHGYRLGAMVADNSAGSDNSSVAQRLLYPDNFTLVLTKYLRQNYADGFSWVVLASVDPAFSVISGVAPILWTP
jgi:hypothetical protein